MKKIIILFFAATITYTSAKTQPQPPKPPTIEERLKKVDEKITQEMQLSADKKKQVALVYKDFFGKMDELRKNNPAPQPPPPPPPGKKEDVDKLVKERDEKIAKVLSADEFKKYKEVEKTLRPPMPPQNKDGKNQTPPPKQD